MDVLTGEREYFKGIDKIKYEGPESDNPLAFKYYNPEKRVGDKTMQEHLHFAVAYWHSFSSRLADPFGPGTRELPWLQSKDPIQRARDKMDAAFEFMTKMGLKYFCFHDVDLVDEAETIAESERRLQSIVDYAKEKKKESGIELLWGTANLFSHPRYMNGAGTNPVFEVVAHAGAQLKRAIDATIELDGHNYVFWGGREGYMTLLNTQMKKEKDHYAQLLTMARDYARKNGFKGNFFVEPKPMEPMKQLYDTDAATVLQFLREYDLMDDFKLNIEANHATLALHSFEHELQVAADAGMLGSIDANRGDEQNGWDTDQFPTKLNDVTRAMLVILEAGGLQGGGINFDAKLTRNSTDLEDMFHAHIGAMDTFARGLMAADDILRNSSYSKLRKERYATFENEEGKRFVNGSMSLEDLRRIAVKNGEPQQVSGRQEFFENLLNTHIR